MTKQAIAGSAIASFVFGACGGPRGPVVRPATPLVVAIDREGSALRGVTVADGAIVVARTTTPAGVTPTGEPSTPAVATTTVEARRDGRVAWSTELAGAAGPIAATAQAIVVPVSGIGALGGGKTTAVRGEPGAIAVALDAATGAVRWQLPIDAGEWVIVSAVAAADDAFYVAGSYSGSLRIRDRVVGSGGRSDGFVAKLTAAGEIAWLVRMGGTGPDAIQGVAARGGKVAIAGTFTAGADLLGAPLPAFDDKSPFADGFVAVLREDGTRAWSASFGGKQPESVAGVAIDTAGRVAVAASARDTVHVGSVDVVAQGTADGLVAWWTPDGKVSHAIRIGGDEFDGLRAITAVGERIVVGGFYAGQLLLADRTLAAAGGDGAFLAAFDARGELVDAWDVGGDGREEIAALDAVPGGFVAGITHTAGATIDGDSVPAPADPLGGATIVIRAVR